MSTSREQRQRQELQERLQRDELDKKGKEELKKLEEGQEISPELAGQLQPQLGNAALNNLLNRASTTAQGHSSAGAAQTEEVGEETAEVQEEEELQGEELEAPLYGGGGSGGGGGGGGDPWDMGRLFGGDDDGEGGGDGAHNPRLRASPIREGEHPLDEEPPPEDDPEAVDPLHLRAVDDGLARGLPDLPARVGPRQGDARHHAVEDALLDPAKLARAAVHAEDLVGRGGPRSPLGRPLAVARFLAVHGRSPRARALSRGLAGGAAALLVDATGASGAIARLCALATCASVAEAGEGDSAAAVDRAVAMALATDAWPRAVAAARVLARKRKLHAPQIAARTLGAPVPPGGTAGREASPDSLAGRAVAGLLPAPSAVVIPSLSQAELPPVAEDDALAALDALLAGFTGGPDPRALPPDPLIDGEAIQPVLDAASELVNLLGRAQVEFAAAAVAACQARADAPVQQALVHGDRALRLLAREVVEAGEAVAALRGSPRAGSGVRAAPRLKLLREAAVGLDALRAWVLANLAAAGAGGAAPEVGPEEEGPLAAAEAARSGGDAGTARALLRRETRQAPWNGEAWLRLGLAALEAGDRDEAATALTEAWAFAAQDTWAGVVVGTVLSALRLDQGDRAGAVEVAARLAEAARHRHHPLALAAATITQVAAAHPPGAGPDALPAAVEALVRAALELRQQGAEAAVNLVKARLAELRAGADPRDFDRALARAAGVGAAQVDAPTSTSPAP